MKLAKRKINEAKAIAVAAARIAEERNCTDIVVLDLRGLSPATDYFVIATGTSDRQRKSVADEITMKSKSQGYGLFGKAGYESAKWILLDFVDVMVHIFDAEHREYYDLELLWGDAKKVKWEKPKRKKAAENGKKV